jgi:hypothetical protein
MAVEFAIVLHFHQPVGNFGDVVARVTERCYRPLLQLLEQHPAIKTHLHLNGILLEWMDRDAPELVAAIGRMVGRGSVEMITGGHQEPILSVLPERDAVGQIVALSDELELRFGHRPAGLWLTERVWEPRLPTPLRTAGVQYTILDDSMLRWAGVEEGGLDGYWMAEDQGSPLAIYPGRKQLRYTIPFRPHEETLQFLHALPGALGQTPLAVYADDAEKFGEWPRTHEWVFTKGWLPRFLELLEQEQHEQRVRTVHLSGHLRAHPPRGRVYPPTASYHELTEWALPTPARLRLEALVAKLDRDDPLGAREFVRGGTWRGFLAKYPEADRMHKRMLRVSAQLHELNAPSARAPDAPLPPARRTATARRKAATRTVADEARLAAARRDLYRGQCNDAYWHGSFGGLYLVHLRRAVERHLIRAERALDGLAHGAGARLEIRRIDLDADGRDELEIRTPHAVVVVDPDQGGAVTEWALRGPCDNLVTVLRRHDEAFHAALRGLTDDQLAALIRGSEQEAQGGDSQGIATIHGGLRVKPGVRLADLRVDSHPRVACLEWAAPAAPLVGDPDAQLDAATPLHGPWEARQPAGEGELTLEWQDSDRHIVKRLRAGSRDASLMVNYDTRPLGGGAPVGAAAPLVGTTPLGGGPWVGGDSPLAAARPWRLVSEWNLLVGYTGDDLEVEQSGEIGSAVGGADVNAAAGPGAGGSGAGRTAAPAGARMGVERLRFHGGGERSLLLTCSPPADVCWAPVHTISSSEGGLEKTGQGTVFLVSWLVERTLQATLTLTPTAPDLPDER